jgi:hypothetical protein
MPPALASGDIRKKGTAVVTTLMVSTLWAFRELTPAKKKRMTVSFAVFRFIIENLSVFILLLVKCLQEIKNHQDKNSLFWLESLVKAAILVLG